MTPQNVSNTHGGVIFDTEMDYKEYLKSVRRRENGVNIGDNADV